MSWVTAPRWNGGRPVRGLRGFGATGSRSTESPSTGCPPPSGKPSAVRWKRSVRTHLPRSRGARRRTPSPGPAPGPTDGVNPGAPRCPGHDAGHVRLPPNPTAVTYILRSRPRALPSPSKCGPPSSPVIVPRHKTLGGFQPLKRMWSVCTLPRSGIVKVTQSSAGIAGIPANASDALVPGGALKVASGKIGARGRHRDPAGVSAGSSLLPAQQGRYPVLRRHPARFPASLRSPSEPA